MCQQFSFSIFVGLKIQYFLEVFEIVYNFICLIIFICLIFIILRVFSIRKNSLTPSDGLQIRRKLLTSTTTTMRGGRIKY